MPRFRRLLPPLLLAALAAGLTRLLPARPHAEGPLPPAAHETSDVGFRPMLIAGIAMLGGLAAVMGVAFWLYPGSVHERQVPLPLPGFPAPQLQTDPAADMAAFQARQRRQLDTAYWTLRGARQLHLPISQAMQDVARRGIADWPAP